MIIIAEYSEQCITVDVPPRSRAIITFVSGTNEFKQTLENPMEVPQAVSLSIPSGIETYQVQILDLDWFNVLQTYRVQLKNSKW